MAKATNKETRFKFIYRLSCLSDLSGFSGLLGSSILFREVDSIIESEGYTIRFFFLLPLSC